MISRRGNRAERMAQTILNARHIRWREALG
jgi:hypothetical protein